MLRDHMLPHTGTWTLNETILASGQATADNLAAQMAHDHVCRARARCGDAAENLCGTGQNAEAAARASAIAR